MVLNVVDEVVDVVADVVEVAVEVEDIIVAFGGAYRAES